MISRNVEFDRSKMNIIQYKVGNEKKEENFPKKFLQKGTKYSHSRTHSHVLPSDSLMVSIPISLTADLGLAMKLVRSKRIKKILDFYPTLLTLFKNRDIIDNKVNVFEYGKATLDLYSNCESRGKYLQINQKKKNRSINNNNVREENGYSMKTAPINGNIRREQYASVLDYLEAKYVKGVMIGDLDEKLQRRRKISKEICKQKQQKSGNRGQYRDKARVDKNVADDTEDLYFFSESEVGSCYSDSSGNFIDDTELKSEVAQQVLASSAFITTRIEAENTKKRNSIESKNHCRTLQSINKSSNVDPYECTAHNLYDEDGSFFVNIGELEMEDGWLKENKDSNSKCMSLNRKRKEEKDKHFSKYNHNVNKMCLSKYSSYKGSKSILGDHLSQYNNVDRSIPLITKLKRKNMEEATTKVSKKCNFNESKRSYVYLAKKEASFALIEMNRVYKKCLSEIRKLPEKNLPRNKSKMGVIKLSITVPQNKKGGDKIIFSNPHVQGQKLRVQIPQNRDPGGKFVVSVPEYDVKRMKNKNTFSTLCTETLNAYSLAYDHWHRCEVAYRLLASNKNEEGEQQLKFDIDTLGKYEEMVKELPQDLIHPIDAGWLRKLVRHAGQKSNNHIKLPVAALDNTEMIEPLKGMQFPLIKFNASDFNK